MGLGDPRIRVFITWCKIQRTKRTRILIHENVAGFPVWFAQALLPDYDLHALHVDTKSVGFGLMSRSRQYLICYHKERTLSLHDPTTVFQHVRASLETTIWPDQALVADVADIREEEVRVCMARGIPIGPYTGDLSHVFSANEIRYLHTYLAEFWNRFSVHPLTVPFLCVHLGDNPQNRLSWSAAGRIPTLRKSMGFLYFPSARRWLTRRELLALLGWPTFPHLARAMQTEQLIVDPSTASFMLGNAMHLPCVSSVLAVALCCARFR
jgi:hypothetical protein